ncbi:GntR family transcriptional regulator [Microbacterium sp. LMC-P-041]|uniref:GntR family transcriptional regulator n=1 Tax=Microbacterium sp. LMC-P-041 TaxID=3040293 RepID=UPI0025545240|nr:GntR family transcriptional regulator [Microbacterium sp. LMC-P-041]
MTTSDGRPEVSAKDRAYDVAKRRIVVGEWKPGALLSEAVVGRELAMSRTPVHAAFVQLAAEGLLELRSRHGAVVAPIRSADAGEILEVREALETLAARRSLALGDARRLAADLSRSLDAQRTAHLSDDAEAFAIADAKFHALIVACGENRILQDFVAQLDDRQDRLRRHALEALASEREILIEDHRLLQDSIRRSDLAAFSDVLHMHLSRQLGAVEKVSLHARGRSDTFS